MARRRSAVPAPAPAPKPAREYNGAGTWDEVATSSSTASTDAREYERELWRVRAAGLGVEVHEFVHRPPRSQSGTLVLLARRPPEAPQDWREQVGRALTGHVGIGEPPSLLRAWATTDDAADEGATLRQLVIDALQREMANTERPRKRLTKPPVKLAADAPLRGMSPEQIKNSKGVDPRTVEVQLEPRVATQRVAARVLPSSSNGPRSNAMKPSASSIRRMLRRRP
jgi:hypothetical protein